MTAEQVAADEAAVDLPAPPSPQIDVDSAGYWAAAERGEFALCRCAECRRWLHPPLERCRYCGGTTAFEEASGRGLVYSFIVVRHPSIPAFGPLLPYVIVLVDLDEGVRLTGRLLGDPSAVRVCLPVVVRMERLPGADRPGVVFAMGEPGGRQAPGSSVAAGDPG